MTRAQRRAELSRAGRLEMALRLRYVRRWTIAQVAAEMCVKPCTVRQMLRRSRKAAEATPAGWSRSEPCRVKNERVLSLSLFYNV